MTLPYAFGDNNSLLRFPTNETNCLPLTEALGLQWMRDNAPLLASSGWPGIAPTTATSYNSAAVTAIVALETAYAGIGVKLLVTLSAAISTSSVNGVSFSPADFGSACAWIAGQCPGLTWELNNEPDINGISAAQYTACCVAAYSAMKTADPTCTVVAGVLSNIAVAGGQAYMTSCYTAGIKGHYDAVSVHPYNTQNGYPSNFDPGHNGSNPFVPLTADFQAIMASNTDSAPLWFTEFGWVTGTGGSDVTEAQQAAFTSTALLEMETLGIPVVMAYDFLDGGSGGGGPGIVRFDFSTKPSYLAIQSLLSAGAIRFLNIGGVRKRVVV